MEDKRSYYAVIPANVRYDKSLPSSAKLLYGEVSALCNQNGFCWAENCYFAELYDVSDRTIQAWINALVNSGYLYRNFLLTDDGKKTTKRCLSIVEMSPDFMGVRKKLRGGYEENFMGGMKKTSPIILQENNTCEYNSTIRRVEEGRNSKQFQKPRIDEVQSYCAERQNNVDPEAFWNFYESKGWRVGNQPMKNWKAAIVTWERDPRRTVKTGNSREAKSYGYDEGDE